MLRCKAPAHAKCAALRAWMMRIQLAQVGTLRCRPIAGRQLRVSGQTTASPPQDWFHRCRGAWTAPASGAAQSARHNADTSRADGNEHVSWGKAKLATCDDSMHQPLHAPAFQGSNTTHAPHHAMRRPRCLGRPRKVASSGGLGTVSARKRQRTGGNAASSTGRVPLRRRSRVGGGA